MVNLCSEPRCTFFKPPNAQRLCSDFAVRAYVACVRRLVMLCIVALLWSPPAHAPGVFPAFTIDLTHRGCYCASTLQVIFCHKQFCDTCLIWHYPRHCCRRQRRTFLRLPMRPFSWFLTQRLRHASTTLQSRACAAPVCSTIFVVSILRAVPRSALNMMSCAISSFVDVNVLTMGGFFAHYTLAWRTCIHWLGGRVTLL